MAQTLQQQDSRESSSNSENKSLDNNQQQPPPPPQLISSKLVGSRASPAGPPPLIDPKESTVAAVSSPATAQTDPTPIFNRHQLSKVFITKCRTELEALLNSIKDKYHEEIKALNNNETLYADFFVQIGEEFRKPLHKCIISSRAFKLYNALKAFELVEVPVEDDIIVSEFQDKDLDEEGNSASADLEAESKEKTRVDTPEGCLTTIAETNSILHCHLPDNLITPDLFLNLIRRVYLDQDISEEESRLYQTLIDWLKLNKPELIKTPKRHSPDHRTSFRTVQPLFEETPPSSKSPAMHAEQNLLDLSEDIHLNADEVYDASQTTGAKEESLTSSLPRTETFELLTRNYPDSPSVATPDVSHDGDDDDKVDVRSDVSNANSSNTSTPAPYAPTTRTGLKPKTFTTPVNMRPATRGAAQLTTSNTKTTTVTPSQITKSSARDENQKSKSPGGSAVNAKIASNRQTPTAAKRSSLSSNQSETKSPDGTQAVKSIGQASKVKSPAASVGAAANKGKLTTIARAHPISLERSQSPSTNTMNKSSGRNFIAANKRLVSQMEKKTTQSDTPNHDSEAESGDNYSFGLEPLTTDNLIAQMDKYTLISYSKLADALSRLFIDGAMSDTVILVKENRQINAHRCILAARSAFLAEIIDQQFDTTTTTKLQSSAESLANNEKIMAQKLTIDMTEYSYPAVFFSIMHIYSGLVKVPDDLDLEELTKLTNQLHVTTLRQVCMHNLRMNYCHYFHKPCNVCCVGVLKTLPLAWRYDYTDLYAKCLHWIGSHFAQIFCLKEFSELKPHDLVEECYSATLSQLTPENVIPKTIECQKLLKNLPRVKWTESIICLVGRQLEDFCHYVADNYEKILQSESFLNLGKNCWECEVLEENLLAAMNHLKPDSGCKTLIQLHKIECSLESFSEDSRNMSDSFSNLVSKMRKYCERYLLKEAASVVHCSSWRHMNPSLQKRIKDQAIISTDFDEPTKQLAAKPKLLTSSRLSSNNHQSTLPSQTNNYSTSEGVRSPSNRSTPDSKLKSPSTTYLPPPKSKTAAARHVKVLK